MKLTQSNVTTIKPNGKKQWVSDDDTRGLKLYVGPTGIKVWYYVKRDANRKVVYRKIGPFPDLTLSEAREQARILGGKIALKEDIKREKPHEKMKLSELLDRYELHYVQSQKSGAFTMKVTRSFIAPLLNKPIDQITPAVIDDFRLKDKRAKEVKNTTFNKSISVLRNALAWGTDEPDIPLNVNPLARMKRLKEHDNLVVTKFMSDDEVERLLAALDQREDNMRKHRANHEDWNLERKYGPLPVKVGEFVDYIKPLIITALHTGARRGSIFALEWRDVDFDAKKIILRPEVSKTAEAVTVPMDNTLFDTLSKWREQCNDTGRTTLVFPSPVTGEKLDNINTAWENIRKAAKLEHYRFHDLRHYFGSKLANIGTAPLIVKKLLGHRNLTTTERYLHAADEGMINAINRLDGVIPTGTPDSEQQERPDNIRHIFDAIRKTPQKKSQKANQRRKSAS
jgi:integrase